MGERAGKSPPAGVLFLQRLVGEELASSLEIVLADKDLAPASEGAPSEDSGRRDIRVPVEALDTLAAEETAQGFRLAFVGHHGQPNRFSHAGIFTPRAQDRACPASLRNECVS